MLRFARGDDAKTSEYIEYEEKAIIGEAGIYLSGPTAVVAAVKKACWQKRKILLVIFCNPTNKIDVAAEAGAHPARKPGQTPNGLERHKEMYLGGFSPACPGVRTPGTWVRWH